MFCFCHTVLSVPCLRSDLFGLYYITFSCVFVTLPHGVLGQVLYLIVSIPDLCLLPYFVCLLVANCDIGLCVTVIYRTVRLVGVYCDQVLCVYWA